eukprot:182631_1
MKPLVHPILTNLSNYSDTTVSTNTSVELSPISNADTSPYSTKWNPDEIDMVFIKNGYKKINTIKKTLQGELYKASIIANRNDQSQYVAIKRTSKYLYKQNIAIEDNINFCVSENIIKESLILKYLTVDHKPIGDYITTFIQFFQSDTDYFLVMEYIDTEMNLKQFISRASQYIQQGKLALVNYHKIIKYLLWQLFVTIQYLHDSMNCCHLDIHAENIMV